MENREIIKKIIETYVGLENKLIVTDDKYYMIEIDEEINESFVIEYLKNKLYSNLVYAFDSSLEDFYIEQLKKDLNQLKQMIK